MPTPKQVRACMKRILYHERRLQVALNDAHNKGVIDYIDYHGEAPCASMSDLRRRIVATTEKARADAVYEEISEEVGWP